MLSDLFPRQFDLDDLQGLNEFIQKKKEEQWIKDPNHNKKNWKKKKNEKNRMILLIPPPPLPKQMAEYRLISQTYNNHKIKNICLERSEGKRLKMEG